MRLARHVFVSFGQRGVGKARINTISSCSLQTREMATEVEAWTTALEQDGEMFAFCKIKETI